MDWYFNHPWVRVIWIAGMFLVGFIGAKLLGVGG